MRSLSQTWLPQHPRPVGCSLQRPPLPPQAPQQCGAGQGPSCKGSSPVQLSRPPAYLPGPAAAGRNSPFLAPHLANKPWPVSPAVLEAAARTSFISTGSSPSPAGTFHERRREGPRHADSCRTPAWLGLGSVSDPEEASYTLVLSLTLIPSLNRLPQLIYLEQN